MDQKDQNNLDESFRHYRNAAVYTTGTVIVFSSAIIGWTSRGTIIFDENLALKIVLLVLGWIPLGLSILTGILIQYFIFRGYFKKARKESSQPIGEPDLDFNRADNLMCFCVCSFFLGFLTIFVLFAISLFSK